MKEKDSTNVINESKLKEVSGGWNYGQTLNYESDDTSLFKVGDKVRFNSRSYFNTDIEEGTITQVNGKTGSIFKKEFTYNIQLNNGTIEENIYESQIIIAMKGL